MNKFSIALANLIQDPTVALALLMLAFISAFILHVWIDEHNRTVAASKRSLEQ